MKKIIKYILNCFSKIYNSKTFYSNISLFCKIFLIISVFPLLLRFSSFLLGDFFLSKELFILRYPIFILILFIIISPVIYFFKMIDRFTDSIKNRELSGVLIMNFRIFFFILPLLILSVFMFIIVEEYPINILNFFIILENLYLNNKGIFLILLSMISYFILSFLKKKFTINNFFKLFKVELIFLFLIITFGTSSLLIKDEVNFKIKSFYNNGNISCNNVINNKLLGKDDTLKCKSNSQFIFEINDKNKTFGFSNGQENLKFKNDLDEINFFRIFNLKKIDREEINFSKKKYFYINDTEELFKKKENLKNFINNKSQILENKKIFEESREIFRGEIILITNKEFILLKEEKIKNGINIMITTFVFIFAVFISFIEFLRYKKLKFKNN